jgi:integrase/recombinase XerC
MTHSPTPQPLARREQPALPPILAGRDTPAMRQRVQDFFSSIASIFEAWVTRRQSPHTQRAYRADVMAFVEFLQMKWPEEATHLLSVSVRDVLAFREQLVVQSAAPKTINRRISSLSSFYKYLAAAAAEMRLPITVPNPAHAQFISRESTDPREETRALSATRARQLMGLPAGDTVIDFRDRAILRTFLYSGIRLGTACRLRVQDFHQDGDESTLRLHEKGDKRRTIGLHFNAAQAIKEYIEKAGLTSGPLFRPRKGSRGQKLADRFMEASAMYLLVQRYMHQLPGAVKEMATEDGDIRRACIYTPHSLRATTATLLLDANVDIRKVQDLLGHRHITTTQIYDKRRRSTSESASHDVPI